MEKFWKQKKLSEFTKEEWESICMKCGKCCMIKYVSRKTVFFSKNVCKHLDCKTGLCSMYRNRLQEQSCVEVNLALLQEVRELLPMTCAYRLLFEGKDLPEYHPLITKDETSVLKAGKTVLAYDIKPENDKDEHLLFDELLARSIKKNWSEKKFWREFDEYCKKRKDVFVESYPKPEVQISEFMIIN